MSVLPPVVWVGNPAVPDRRPLRRNLLLPVANRPHLSMYAKPLGGLWTSPLRTDGRYESGWIEWCWENEVIHWLGDAWVLRPTEARVFTIHDEVDLRSLHKRFGGWDQRATYAEPFIDWPAVGREYDAVHLTEHGQWATRMTNPFTLYGWDCETVFWFRWRFSSHHRLPEPSERIVREMRG